jgi:Family of unknown function (DUF6049)
VSRSAGTRLAVACGALVLATAPLAAAPLAAGPAAAASAAAGASPGPVSVAITSVTPDVATPGKPVTVTGTVSNATARAVSGLSVQIRSSGSALTSRGDLTNYAAGNLPVDSPVAGAVAQLPGSLSSGSTEKWSVSLSARELGMTAFGVYPLAAEVDGAGVALDADRSFLPFWPARSTLAGPLQIAWVWPVMNSPQQAACGALLNNHLAASLAPGGRLAGLLAAGSTPAASGADLTWAIDPGLLASAEAITKPYRAGGSETCAGTTTQPASTSARNWLAGLTAVTARQDFFVTPYDDVDVAALTHQGMDSDLTHAFNEGRSAARAILGSAQRPATAATDQEQGHVSLPTGIGGMAWPADGIADYGVLGNLAVNGVGTVILDSSLMPPVTQVSYTPSAVTQTPDGVGSVLHVALADHTLTQIVGSAPTPATAGSATAQAATAGASFATEQRFLAETAMIAAEAPALRRSVVVAPPREWDPAPGVASALLSETVSAPWLSPVSLTDLVKADSTAGQVPRQQPPQQLVSSSELSASLLGQVQQLDERLRLHGSILDPPNPAYLAKAVAAVESSAWRGPRGAGQASRLLARVSAYLAAREQLVTIIDASRVTLGGQSGSIPVSIRNRLTQAVTIRLEVQAPSNSGITILPYNKTVTIAAGSLRTVAVHVQAAAAGTTTLRLSLLTTGNAPLPYGASTLTVDATHFGTLALVIIGIAVGVFVLTAAGRAFRRGGGRGGAAADGHGGGPADDADGPDPATGPGEPVAVRPTAGPPDDAPPITEPFTIWPEPAERQVSPPAEPDEYARWPG